MNNIESVYDYIVDNVKRTLTNGIEYYEDKDEELKQKLENIYHYINGDLDSQLVLKKEEIVPFVPPVASKKEVLEAPLKVSEEPINNEQEVTLKVENDIFKEDTLKKVKTLIEVFLSRITDIKIDVLRIEDSLYNYQLELASKKPEEPNVFSSYEENEKENHVINNVNLIEDADSESSETLDYIEEQAEDTERHFEENIDTTSETSLYVEDTNVEPVIDEQLYEETANDVLLEQPSVSEPTMIDNKENVQTLEPTEEESTITTTENVDNESTKTFDYIEEIPKEETNEEDTQENIEELVITPEKVDSEDQDDESDEGVEIDMIDNPALEEPTLSIDPIMEETELEKTSELDITAKFDFESAVGIEKKKDEIEVIDDTEEEELIIEPPRKKSILDIFRKN